MALSIQDVWKRLEQNAHESGDISEKGSVDSVAWLARLVGIENVDSPAWSGQLVALLKKAGSSEDLSDRVAAAGIARSFRILGTWGYLLAKTPEQTAMCEQAVKASGIYLRSIGGNFIVRWADWLREKIGLFLCRRMVLTGECEEAYRRRQWLSAREDEGFDAVVSFADTGMRGELGPIDEKIRSKKITPWEATLKWVESFLHDVFPRGLSSQDEVARQQMLWRLLSREIDSALGREADLSEQEMKRLKSYVWQYTSVLKVLESHRQRGHWVRKAEDRPHTLVKRCIEREASYQFAMKIMQRAQEAGLIRESDNPLVILTTTA